MNRILHLTTAVAISVVVISFIVIANPINVEAENEVVIRTTDSRVVLPDFVPAEYEKYVPTPTPTPEPTPVFERPEPIPEPFSGQWSFKSYESYKAITNTSSPQYALQQEAYTGDYGIRMVDGRYCVAMGSYWATEIGTKMDVTLETGEVIPVILGDNKQDIHTDSTHRYGSTNHDVLEFIVDMSEIPTEVSNCGSFNCIFEGKVSKVEIVE